MSDLAAFWFKFFIDAGIPASDAGSYAVSFTENRIYSHMITDLTKENLKELGVNALGDTIAILKHIEMFKLQEAKNKVLQGSEFIKSQNVLTATRLSANVAPTTTTSKIAPSHTTAATTASEYSQQPLHIINSNKAIPQQHHQQQQQPQSQQPQLQQPKLQQPQLQQPQVQQQQSNPLNKILSVKQNLKQQQHHHHQQSLTTITTTTPTVATDTNSSLNSNNTINISSNEHKITQARLTKTNMIKDKTKAVTPTMNSTKINNSTNISNNNKSSSSSSNKIKTTDTPSKHIHNFLDDLKNNNKEDGKKLSSKNGSTTTTTSSSNNLGSVFSRLGKSMSDSKDKSEIKTYKSPIVEDIEREHPGIFSRLGCRNLRPTQTSSSPATSNKNMNCTKSSDNNNDDDDDDDDDVGEDDENDYEVGDNEEEENYHIHERDDENFGEGDEDDENFVSDDDDKDYIIMSAINQSRSRNNQSATSQPLTISAGVLSSNSVLPARHRPPSHGFFSPQTQNVNTDNVVKGSLASRLGKKVSESVVKAKVLNTKNANDGGGDIAEALAIVRKKTDHSSPLNRLVKAELKTIEIEKKPKKTKLVAVSEGIFQKAVSSFTKLNRNTSNVTGGRATTGDSNSISTAASVNNNTQRCSDVVAKVDNFGKTPILSRLGKRTITMPLDVVSTKKSAREGVVSGVFARLGQKN